MHVFTVRSRTGRPSVFPPVAVMDPTRRRGFPLPTSGALGRSAVIPLGQAIPVSPDELLWGHFSVCKYYCHFKSDDVKIRTDLKSGGKIDQHVRCFGPSVPPSRLWPPASQPVFSPRRTPGLSVLSGLRGLSSSRPFSSHPCPAWKPVKNLALGFARCRPSARPLPVLCFL